MTASLEMESMMKSRTPSRILALLTSILAIPALSLAAETYAVDPSHLSIVFSCSHSSLSYTYGMFRKAQGSYLIDKTNPANCRFRFSVDASSLDTNQAERDQHLRSPDFFNVQLFPAIAFDSTACTGANTQQGGIMYQVTGNLTIHGVTRQVTIPVQLLGEGKGVAGDQRTGLFANFELKRTEFGMNNLLNLVGDAVGVTVSFEGILQQGNAGTPTATR
ncbi:MAG: YceI family protein [Planctomycetes bacterium]|nr:YceI family protein [Planctomycetota bacterium]